MEVSILVLIIILLSIFLTVVVNESIKRKKERDFFENESDMYKKERDFWRELYIKKICENLSPDELDKFIKLKEILYKDGKNA